MYVRHGTVRLRFIREHGQLVLNPGDFSYHGDPIHVTRNRRIRQSVGTQLSTLGPVVLTQ